MDYLKIVTILWLSILTTSSFAISKPTTVNYHRPNNFLTSISNILDTSAGDTNVGIIIKSLDSGAVLYERNAKHFFMPASILKIVTAITALDYLGSDYKFVTKIITNSQEIKNGTLNGDIYLHFDGDPTLTKNDLEQLISQLSTLGIKTIRGNIYIDDYIYDQKKYAKGWMWDELNLCYAAPIAGIIINKNCFSLELNSTTDGKIAKITEKDTQPLSSIYSNVITKSKASDCQLNINATENNEYYLNGCIFPKKQPITIQVPIKNLRLYSQRLLVSLLQKYSIDITGKIGTAPMIQNGYILASHSSEPLNQLVAKMMKHSDNLIANSLYKKISSYYFNSEGTWLNGGKAAKQILIQNARINLEKAKIFDGSGLSRYNLITPEQMMQLLVFAYNDSDINQDFIKSLPIGGIDGSLHWRLGKKDIINKIIAKTGTMTGISSLAGYIETVSHKKLAFVIMFNSFSDSPRKYEQIEDRICEILVRL